MFVHVETHLKLNQMLKTWKSQDIVLLVTHSLLESKKSLMLQEELRSSKLNITWLNSSNLLCCVGSSNSNRKSWGYFKRSLRVLEEAELVIFCEDTRVTKTTKSSIWKIWDRLSNKEYRSFHSHNENQILKI